MKSSSFSSYFTILLFIAFNRFTSINAKEWIKHQFKIVIERSSRECFYQTVEQDAVLHVSYQVIKGDDITFFLTDPNREILKLINQENTGSHQMPKVKVKGDYEICFDNSHSMFNEKLVSIYMITFHQDKLLEKFNRDKEVNETVHLAREVSDKISINLVEIFAHQAMTRFRQTKDDYLINANNSLVFYWSLFQTIFIVLCGIFQVYFIKKLFNAPKIKNFK